MASAPTAQQCHALITYFINQHESRLGKKPLVNRNKARPGVASILMDYTPTQARELVDHYLEHWEHPTMQWFVYHYDEIDEDKQSRERNEEAVKARREQTKQRLEEWRNRWKK